MKKLIYINLCFILFLFSCNDTQSIKTDNQTENQEENSDSTSSLVHKIGDKFQGGYIISLDFDGKHGLICSPSGDGDFKSYLYSDVIKISKKELNGFKDWRIPTKEEMYTAMTFYSKNDISKDLLRFKNVIYDEEYATGYWTSDEDKERKEEESNFKQGEVGESNSFHVEEWSGEYRFVAFFKLSNNEYPSFVSKKIQCFVVQDYESLGNPFGYTEDRKISADKEYFRLVRSF